MLKRNNITIKRLMIAGGVLTTFILLFIGLVTNVFIKNTDKQYSLIYALQEIENLELKTRKAEKDFLVYETINDEFYMTKQSPYLNEIAQNLDFITKQLKELTHHNTIEKLGYSDDLTLIADLFVQYQTQLNKLVYYIGEKGFKDYGIEGEMRAQIHTVESEIKKIKNTSFAVKMLTLRRHEKDYLLRKDLKYKTKFDDELSAFIAEIQAGNAEYHYLIPILNDYRSKFFKIIDIDIQIGLDNSSGLRSEINNGITEIEAKLAAISESVNEKSHKEINGIVLTLSVLITLFSGLIVYIFFQISRHIVRSISNLRKHITLLGHGELPDEIPIYNNDEIAHMKASINELTKNLKNTKQFAESVGNGNFEQEIDVFGNEGDLGSALVEMRNKLLQVSKEREEQMRESQLRLWANDGFNQIHQILSSAETMNDEFFYHIIAKLVRYLNAAQGTLMMVQERNGEKTLVQKGTYAFDRNRLNQKELKIGEGIIGAVAFEKQTTHMTHLPTNYLNITSGLGDAQPQNLLVVPCLSEGELLGVLELASFNPFEKHEIAFVESIASDLGNNLRKLQIEETTNMLLEKTKVQSLELSEKEEEMRQNFEELKATQEALQMRESELLTQIERLERENNALRSKPVLN